MENYSDITYIDEINHCIDTNNSKIVFTESYWDTQIHKQEVKHQIPKILDKQIISPSFSHCHEQYE